MGGGGAPTGTMWGPAQTPAGRNAMKRRVRRGRTEGKGALYSAASLIQSGRQPALPQAHCVDPSFLHSWEELGLGRSGLVLGSQFPVSLEHDGHNGGWGLRPKSPNPAPTPCAPHPQIRTLVISASSADPQTKSTATSGLEEDIRSP